MRWLDDGFRVPGTSWRFGLDGVIGLLFPAAGDVAGLVASLTLVALAVREGAPRGVLARMLLNIALDFGLGAVPLIGDAFDFVFKSNRRNLQLLEATRQPESTQPVRRSWGDYALLGFGGLAVLGLAALPWLLLWWIVQAS